MKISDRGLDVIKQFERFMPSIYDDGAGYLTIGYGHKLLESEMANNTFQTGITEAIATDLLKQDVRFAENAVTNLVKVPLQQHQADALISFVFNIGRGNFAKSTLLSRLNSGHHGEVPYQLSRWVYANGRVMGGLVKRRNVEGRIWEGTYPLGDVYA